MAHFLPRPLTVAKALEDGAQQLRNAEIGGARRDARLLLALSMGSSHPALLDLPSPLDPGALARFQDVLARRGNREPVSRIAGTREFWGLEFSLSPDTLDPRPDSETLIEAAVASFADTAPPARILDLGTGSGCLLCAALTEFPGAWGLGIDSSAGAAGVAATNAAGLGLGSRAMFVAGDWGDALAEGAFDLILANPPYIPDKEIPSLAPEVSRYDPRAALSGGADGLESYRRVLPQARRLVTSRGTVILEVGAGQIGQVSDLVSAASMRVCEVRRDLAGVERCIVASPA